MGSGVGWANRIDCARTLVALGESARAVDAAEALLRDKPADVYVMYDAACMACLPIPPPGY